MSRRLLGISVVWIPLAFLGDGITVLLLPVLIGGDPSTLGLVSFAGLGLAVAVQLAAGVASDRLQPRLDRRQFLAIAALPAIVGALLLGVPSPAVIVGAYLLVQAGAGAIQGPQQAFIPEAIEPAAQGRAAGYRTAFDIGGAFVAFALLGWLAGAGRVGAALVVTAGVLVVAVAVMWALGPHSGRGSVPRAVTRPVRGDASLPPGFAPLVLSRFLFLLGTYVVGRYLVLLIADRTGGGLPASAGDAGALLAGLTLITAVAAVPAGRLADRVGSRTVMTAGALVGALGIAMLVPRLGIAGVVAGGVVMATGNAAFLSGSWSAATRLVDRADAGRLMAIVGIGTGLAAAAAGLLGPWIDAAGFTPALAIGAAASAASVLPMAFARPRPASGQVPA